MSETLVRTRRIRSQDAEAILHLYEAILNETHHPIGPRWSVDQLLQECVDQMGLLLEVSSESEFDEWRPCAFILFRDQVAALEITFLGSTPTFRNRGFTRQLIQEMQTFAPVIWLEVHELNLPARALYTSVGFREVGSRPRYYPDGGAAIVYSYG